MEDTNLSKHELKDIKKKEKEQSRELNANSANRKRIVKKIITWSIIFIIILFVVFLFYRAVNISKDFRSYTSGSVHWHADFSVKLCGQNLDFTNLGDVEHHVGLPLLHTHGDNKIHIEGTVSRPEDINLKNFFKSIDHEFSSNNFDDYTNDNDKCGNDNKVKLLVNGAENLEYENYVVSDGDKIEVIYE